MKTRPPSLPRSYLAALRQHLGETPEAESLAPARALGARALKLGLETLDLAKIHQDALVALMTSPNSALGGDDLIPRAGAFFAEALTPIEEVHRGAREANTQLKLVNKALTQRTVELAASNEELQQEITRRKAVEDSLRASELTTSQLLKKSRHLEQELRHLSRRLLSAQEDERKRISHELHDIVAQTLTGITVRLATLRAETAANAKGLQKKIAETQRLVRKSVDIVHRFARELRPAVLDDLGLIPALESYLKSFMERTGIRASLSAFAGVEALPGATLTVLYRIAQEGLTNVARHAKATQVSVTIVSDEGTIRMAIHDNGTGFQVDGETHSRSTKRLGLLGMRERAEMIGGTFCVDSAPGRETTLRVEIPPHGATGQKKPVRRKGDLNLQCQ